MGVPRRLKPEVGARLITGLVLVSAAAAAWTLIVVVTENIAQLHGVAEFLARCCASGASHHRGAFTPMGAAASVAVLAAVISAGRTFRKQRARPSAGLGAAEFAIIPTDEALAYSLRGQPGQIVVSAGMLRSLDPQQRRVVMAHERSHLRRHHYWYLQATDLAVAALPILAISKPRLHFALERWADEDAAQEVGDRALVASAIARAALASDPEFAQATLGIAGSSVVDRVQLMLERPSGRTRLVEMLFVGLLAVGVGGLALSMLLMLHGALAVLGICM